MRCLMRNCSAFGVVIAMTAVPLYAAAQDDGCKALTDGLIRLATTPNHQFMTQSSGSQPSNVRSSELINTGKAMYVMVDGVWRSSPLTPEMMAQQVKENQNTNKTSCHLLRTEQIDGVDAAVYAVTNEAPESTSSGTVWIARVSGLPLRQQIDLQAETTTAKMHMDTKFIYSGITPPTLGR